jgi:hypothetical protein
VLCDDELGPNCTKLRLGDDYLTTSFPAKGYLYSCTGKNPNAPGSIENKITWIDFTNGTWNFLKKLWLPKGTFNPEPGTYTETLSGDNRQINANNLPVDGKIGDWPMTSYPTLTEIDQNPGIPSLNNSSFIYSANPSEASFPTCVSLGAIGVTKNGVVIYHAADGRGEDAVAREIVDVFGGHPAITNYHYHFIPERLDNESLVGGHSGIVGYINDGFPIYGYRGEDGIEMSNDDLDLCHGHKHGALGYHYHATLEYPYTVGCYIGVPVSGPGTGMGQGTAPGGQQCQQLEGQQGQPPGGQQCQQPEGQQGAPPGRQQCQQPEGQQPEGQQLPQPGVRQCLPPEGQQGQPPGGQQGQSPGGQQGQPPGGQQGGFNMGGGMQQGGFNMGGGMQQGGFNMGGGTQQGGFNMGGGMQQGEFGNLPNPFP